MTHTRYEAIIDLTSTNGIGLVCPCVDANPRFQRYLIMHGKPLSLLLYALMLGVCHQAVEAAAPQITFVQTPQRTQPAQPGPQRQQGLSPEKKKSLSKYGPEDVFPGAQEQDETGRPKQAAQRTQTQRTSPRNNQPKPSASPARIPPATPTPVSVTATPESSPPQVAATQLANALAKNQQSLPATREKSSSVFVPIVLSAATLLVFGALIYVLGMLRKRLREGK